MAITIMGFMIMLIQTFRFFFRINVHFPGWDKSLVYFSALIALLGTLVFLAWQNGWVIFLIIMMVFISLLTIVFVVAAIILLISLLRKKDKEARLFIIAAMPFIVSPILTIIIQMDWVVPICGMWTILVLSWGMFARFKSLQIQNARAALEKEEERNRLIAATKRRTSKTGRRTYSRIDTVA